jgi:Flp pilus assembly protein TadG
MITRSWIVKTNRTSQTLPHDDDNVQITRLCVRLLRDQDEDNCRMLPRRSNRIHKGIAAVQLAVCLPVLMVLVMGTLETTDLIFLRQRLMTVAYEAARTATAPAHTADDGVKAGTDILTARGITGGTVTISPPVTATTATGTEVAASVVAPFSSNSYMKPFVLSGAVTNVTVTVTMIRQ